MTLLRAALFSVLYLAGCATTGPGGSLQSQLVTAQAASIAAMQTTTVLVRDGLVSPDAARAVQASALLVQGAVLTARAALARGDEAGASRALEAVQPEVTYLARRAEFRP